MRAHLKDCDDCRAYADAIDTRRAQHALLAPPLPAILAAGLLAKVLGTAAGGGGVAGARQGRRAAALAGGTATMLAVVGGGALALNNSSDKTTPAAVKVAQAVPAKPSVPAEPKAPPPAKRPPPSHNKATDYPASLSGYGGPGGTTLAEVDRGTSSTDAGPAPSQLLAATTTSSQTRSASQTGAGVSGKGTGLPMTGAEAWLTALLGFGLLLVGAAMPLLRRPSI